MSIILFSLILMCLFSHIRIAYAGLSGLFPNHVKIAYKFSINDSLYDVFMFYDLQLRKYGQGIC